MWIQFARDHRNRKPSHGKQCGASFQTPGRSPLWWLLPTLRLQSLSCWFLSLRNNHLPAIHSIGMEGCSWRSLVIDKLHHAHHPSLWLGDPMNRTAACRGRTWEHSQAAVSLRGRMADLAIHLSQPERPFPLAVPRSDWRGKISRVRFRSLGPEGITFCREGNQFCERLWSRDTVWSRRTHNLLRMGLLSVECLGRATWYSPTPVFHLQNNYKRNLVIPNRLRFKEINLPKITKLLTNSRARIINLSPFLGLPSYWFHCVFFF